MKRMKVLFGNRRMMVLLTLAILVLAATALVASSASFTATSANPGNMFTAGNLSLDNGPSNGAADLPSSLASKSSRRARRHRHGRHQEHRQRLVVPSTLTERDRNETRPPTAPSCPLTVLRVHHRTTYAIPVLPALRSLHRRCQRRVPPAPAPVALHL